MREGGTAAPLAADGRRHLTGGGGDPAESPHDERLDLLTRAARRLLGAPSVLLALGTAEGLRSASSVGLGEQEVSIGGHALRAPAPVVVDDTALDARFRDDPMVVAAPYVRTYAGVALRGPSGDVVGALCVTDTRPRHWSDADVATLRDLAAWAETELARREAERRLREEQAQVVASARQAVLAVDGMKDELAAVAGQELRAPLTALRDSLGLLAGGVLGTLSPQAQSAAEVAVTSTDRLLGLVDDLLDLERLVVGQAVIQRRPHTLATLALSAVQHVQGLADDKGVSVETTVDESTAWCDGDRIVRVLVNLLGNAVRFSPSGGTVDLRGSLADGLVVIDVVDRGRGIPADQLGRVFDRFSRPDASDGDSDGGSGLGLAIARDVVEAHGGTISARSTLGSGSTFTVVLPQRRGNAKQVAGRRADDPPPS